MTLCRDEKSKGDLLVGTYPNVDNEEHGRCTVLLSTCETPQHWRSYLHLLSLQITTSKVTGYAATCHHLILLSSGTLVTNHMTTCLRKCALFKQITYLIYT